MKKPNRSGMSLVHEELLTECSQMLAQNGPVWVLSMLGDLGPRLDCALVADNVLSSDEEPIGDTGNEGTKVFMVSCVCIVFLFLCRCLRVTKSPA